MKFVLNQELVTVELEDASTTVLSYLRTQKRSVGTKEGCASGDCGACTCLVGKLGDDAVHYHTINSCITPLGAIAGKHLVTIEHLAQEQIHPVQAAMVEYHGSQCGFCTPGFVMSLTALHNSLFNNADSTHQQPTREDVSNAVAGNLCRCTGYRPILDAGMAACQSPAPQLHSSEVRHWLKNLDALDDTPYYAPQTLAEWCEIKSVYPTARAIAGGTDLMLEVTQHYRDIPQLIDVTQIRELRGFQLTDKKLKLGAGLNYTQLADHCSTVFPALTAFMPRLASPQIRNRGTLGGNIANASPIADTPPILLAMDATIELYNVAYQRRTLPLDEFYLGYKKTQLAQNELLVSVRIPVDALAHFHRFYKVSKRYEDDISAVMGAFRFHIVNGVFKEARIAYGGVAATPLRVKSAEAALIDQAMDDEKALTNALHNLGDTLDPLSDVRASAGYRLTIAMNLLRKAWLEANGEHLPDIHASAHTEEVNHA
ncbi:xanthine dehydrogenase small subunit [Teredinibacter turnerae]|uniref:xanthine dehydrogenase small subunit n=1 Tax=Teredinibacter turnerae TaxID=2426 RepID=UPI00036C2450|nr:xanthine dehydrogenase small subunit [Teredinibacter turnerae]